jgi:hypothetical protein
MLPIVCILNILELNIHHNVIVLKVTETSLCQCHCQHFHYWMISCLHELPPGGCDSVSFISFDKQHFI